MPETFTPSSAEEQVPAPQKNEEELKDLSKQVESEQQAVESAEQQDELDSQQSEVLAEKAAERSAKKAAELLRLPQQHPQQQETALNITTNSLKRGEALANWQPAADIVAKLHDETAPKALDIVRQAS